MSETKQEGESIADMLTEKDAAYAYTTALKAALGTDELPSAAAVGDALHALSEAEEWLTRVESTKVTYTRQGSVITFKAMAERITSAARRLVAAKGE